MTKRKRVRLKEISERAGISISAVSMSLAGHPDISKETRDMVRSLSQQMGYRTPRSNHERKATIDSGNLRLGLMLVGRQLNDDPMLRALGVEAMRSGARIELYATDCNDEKQLNDQALDFAHGLSGLILTGIVNRSLLDSLECAGIPHVVVGYTTDPPNPNSRLGQFVTTDMVAMGALATNYLLQHGHERIGFVCERMPSALWSARWLRGYHISLAEKHLPIDPRLVYIAGSIYAGGESAADAAHAAESPPTAYIVPDARIAASFLNAMKSRGTVVPLSNIVISGIESQVEFYGLLEYPWIGNKLEHFSSVTIRQLNQIIREPMPCTTEVHVPIATRNLE